MGNAQYDLKEFRKAIGHYREALRSSVQSGYPPFVPYCYSGLAYSWLSLGDLSQALVFADSLAITARNINVYLLLDSYDLKSSIYESRQDFRKALQFHKLHRELKDSLSTAQNRKEMEGAAARYESREKQNEIDRLRQDQELQNARLAQSRTIQYSAAFALLLVLVIAVLAINRYRSVSRIQRQWELEKMRNTIARDLHDDIGSALSSINIAGQLGASGNSPNAPELFSRIRDQSARIMEGMSDIVWSINPHNDEMEKVVSKMKEFAAEILEPKRMELTFQHTPPQGRELDSVKRKNLLLIFKEAINNAAKYSDASLVSVQFHFDDRAISLSISDDGKGFDSLAIRSGNGLQNMKHRAQLLGGTLQVASEPGRGTKISLSAPLT
jgi:signal transduction histidine kinase